MRTLIAMPRQRAPIKTELDQNGRVFSLIRGWNDEDKFPDDEAKELLKSVSEVAGQSPEQTGKESPLYIMNRNAPVTSCRNAAEMLGIPPNKVSEMVSQNCTPFIDIGTQELTNTDEVVNAWDAMGQNGLKIKGILSTRKRVFLVSLRSIVLIGLTANSQIGRSIRSLLNLKSQPYTMEEAFQLAGFKLARYRDKVVYRFPSQFRAIETVDELEEFEDQIESTPKESDVTVREFIDLGNVEATHSQSIVPFIATIKASVDPLDALIEAKTRQSEAAETEALALMEEAELLRKEALMLQRTQDDIAQMRSRTSQKTVFPLTNQES